MSFFVVSYRKNLKLFANIFILKFIIACSTPLVLWIYESLLGQRTLLVGEFQEVH